MASFDFVSFIIGMLLGMIIMLILVWIAYFTRAFLFTYCPSTARPCGATDYFNDPGDALANNPQYDINSLLFINENDELLYKRMQTNTSCNPEHNQVVKIMYPQYCHFSNNSGTTGVWKQTSYNSNIYRKENGTGTTIITNGSCNPSPGMEMVEGSPLLRWDINPIFNTNFISTLKYV